MSRARELSRLGNPNIISADSSFNVGFGTATPKEKVNVVGVVSATQFFGDGSGLDGIASAGIGTALSDDKTKALNTIYFTNNEVVVSNNSIVNPPDSGHIAYTQAPTIVIDDTKELIVSDGDDLLVDVLGISTGTNVDYAARGNGVFGNIYVDNIESSGGQTSVNFPKGLVSTGVATFHSDVSIGGTLTYEDVKNIDSVGLITARTGVRITGGGIDIVGDIGLGAGAQTGTAGQVLTSGGSGASPTWVDAAGGAEYSGIASGAITAGRGVTVAADGKLIGVVGNAAAKGTQAQAAANTNNYAAVVYDTTNDKYVLFYVEGGTGKAKVGTLSGTTITWGTAVTYAASVNTTSQGFYDACYDPHNNKCIVFFKNASNNRGSVCSGTVSGTSITFGTPVIVMQNDIMESGTITYCPNANHNYVIAGNDGSNSRFISNVGYNSGTNSSTWDNNVTLISSNQGFVPGSCWDPVAQKIVVVWSDATNSSRGKMIAGTIASNAVTWGTIQEFSSANCGRATSVVHHPPSGKNVIVWTEGASPDYSRAVTATLSGTTFTLGSVAVVSRNSSGAEVASRISGAVYDATAEKVLVAFGDNQGTVYGTSVSLIVDGINITPSNGYRFQGVDGIHDGMPSLAYDPDSGQDVIVSFDGNHIAYFVEKLMATNMSASNFVGISQASYTNGQTAKISLTGSVNEAVSGLTPATKYYVLADGTLNVTADANNIFAGVAVAANKLYIRGW